MRKSILTRLIGGTLLLVVTIALLALCFFAGLRVDRTMADDAALLTRIQAGVQSAALHVGLMLSSTSQEQLRLHATQARETNTQVLLLSAERPAAVEGAWIYPVELRRALAATVTGLASGWQASLQRVLDEVPRALEGPDDRARFAAAAGGFISDSERAAADLSTSLRGVYETRRNLAGSALALFALVVGIGTMGALAYSLWGLFLLRRDVRLLAALGRRVSEGDVSNLPEIKRADEIGEVADQLRRLASVQTLVGSLRSFAERLEPEYQRISDLGGRVAAMVRGLARAAEEAAHGLSGVVQSVRTVEQTAAAGRDAARQGSAAVESSLEKIMSGMEASRALAERTGRVEEAVSVIGDVADQTELLSLNAAIEAARAGETGRGFSVVAQQVRKLADRSARAASEISDLVQTILDGVRRVGGDAKEALESERRLQRELQGVTAATGSLTELTRSAAEGAERAEAALGAILNAAGEAARRVEEISASGKSLGGIVDGVDRALQQFAEETRAAARGSRELGGTAAADLGAISDRAAAAAARSLPAQEPADIALAGAALPLSLGITPVQPAEADLEELQPAGPGAPDTGPGLGAGEGAAGGAASSAGAVQGPPAAARKDVSDEVIEELEAADD